MYRCQCIEYLARMYCFDPFRHASYCKQPHPYAETRNSSSKNQEVIISNGVMLTFGRAELF